MSVEFDRGSPGKFDSRTLSRETLSRWTGRIHINENNDRFIYYYYNYDYMTIIIIIITIILHLFGLF